MITTLSLRAGRKRRQTDEEASDQRVAAAVGGGSNQHPGSQAANAQASSKAAGKKKHRGEGNISPHARNTLVGAKDSPGAQFAGVLDADLDVDVREGVAHARNVLQLGRRQVQHLSI